MGKDWKKRVQEAIAEKGTSMKAVSLAAGRGETFVRDILKRNMTPSFENMSALARALDLDPYELMESGGKVKPTIVSTYDPDKPDTDTPAEGYSRETWQSSVEGAIPEIDGKLGAGEGQLGEVVNIRVGKETISGHGVVAEWLVPIDYLRNEAKASPKNTIVMEVVGDSMTPTYQPGDRVMIDLSQNKLTSDTVYAISDGTGEPQIKRLQKVLFSDPPQVIVISDNANLERFTVDQDRLTIIGRICGVIARR